MIAHERLHDRNEGAGTIEKVTVEDADDFEEGVVARHDLAGLDAGDVIWGRPRRLPSSPAPAALDAPPSIPSACPREGHPGAAF